ncbi:MAG: hypothetical protein R3F61_32910 [Myxococcota bacterium]
MVLVALLAGCAESDVEPLDFEYTRDVAACARLAECEPNWWTLADGVEGCVEELRFPPYNNCAQPAEPDPDLAAQCLREIEASSCDALPSFEVWPEVCYRVYTGCTAQYPPV